VKRQQLEYTVTQLNQLSYEINEEIRQQAEAVENKVTHSIDEQIFCV
jgi:hypothetical protein